MDPLKPRGSDVYLWALDLFNHGYYWESHVWWEALWHAHGRRGHMADFLKALIKLAAAGVKAKMGEAKGVRLHAERAEVLFQGLLRAKGSAPFAGLDLADLRAMAQEIGAGAESIAADAPASGPAFSPPLTLD